MDKELLIAAVEALAKKVFSDETTIYPGPTCGIDDDDYNCAFYCKPIPDKMFELAGFGKTPEKALANLAFNLGFAYSEKMIRLSRGL